MSSDLSGNNHSRLPAAKFLRLAHLRKLRACEQVAAVCFRIRKGEIEFLLVQTRGSGRRWTFPKGGVEPGLTHAQAAALEAFEEAGVHGRIEEASFAHYVRREEDGRRRSDSRSRGKQERVSAHLCEVLRLSQPQEANRNRTWFSVEKAKRRLQEGRGSVDAAKLVLLLKRAVDRIERSSVFAGVKHEARQNNNRESRPLRADALQVVPFEARETSPVGVLVAHSSVMRSGQRVHSSRAIAVNAYMRNPLSMGRRLQLTPGEDSSRSPAPAGVSGRELPGTPGGAPDPDSDRVVEIASSRPSRGKNPPSQIL